MVGSYCGSIPHVGVRLRGSDRTVPERFTSLTLAPLLTHHKNVKVVYRIEGDRILIISLLETRSDNSAWF